MKAIVLAAGRGERMRPLTDRTPKPLLCAGGRTLIEWQVIRLACSGVLDVVVNVSHLGSQIVDLLGDGSRLGVRIRYSHEREALETAGGIALALPMLGESPFLAVNADIYCEFDYAALMPVAHAMRRGQARSWAHLVLVNNPEHHPEGDFALGPDGTLRPAGATRLTFSGIGVYRPELFAGIVPGSRKALGPLLYEAIDHERVCGEHYEGIWMDIGTPLRLRQLQARLGDGPLGGEASPI